VIYLATTNVNIKRSQSEADAEAKRNLALALAGAGAGLGSTLGPLGTLIGGSAGLITGLIVADETTVLPIDMIAVPAAEFSAVLMGIPPSLRVYMKAGETIQPTGPNVVKTKATKKRRASNKKQSESLRLANKKLRNKNGQLKKGKTQSDVMKLAQRLRKKMK
jgi:hypothetical protein